jgi:aspartate/methionine/tyrosine aminotransferase
VVIVPGGKPVMFFTMLMLVNPGDEVIYPNRAFPIYESCIKFAGGVPVPIP